MCRISITFWFCRPCSLSILLVSSSVGGILIHILDHVLARKFSSEFCGLVLYGCCTPSGVAVSNAEWRWSAISIAIASLSWFELVGASLDGFGVWGLSTALVWFLLICLSFSSSCFVSSLFSRPSSPLPSFLDEH